MVIVFDQALCFDASEGDGNGRCGDSGSKGEPLSAVSALGLECAISERSRLRTNGFYETDTFQFEGVSSITSLGELISSTCSSSCACGVFTALVLFKLRLLCLNICKCCSCHSCEECILCLLGKLFWCELKGWVIWAGVFGDKGRAITGVLVCFSKALCSGLTLSWNFTT